MIAPRIGGYIYVIFLAVFLAAKYFLYMHSKKKTNFYMAIPIKRTKQFVLGVMTCACVFWISWFAETCMEILLICVNGYMSKMILGYLIGDIVCTALIFWASWGTMTLAMVVTGNTAVAV